MRLKAVRKTEDLAQPEFADMVGIPLGTYQNLEQGKGSSWTNIEKIIMHERFYKYSLWITTGATCDECGQISATAPGMISEPKVRYSVTPTLSEEQIAKLLKLADKLDSE